MTIDQATLNSLQELPTSELAKIWNESRHRRSEIQKTIDPQLSDLKLVESTIKNVIGPRLDAEGGNSIKTEYGTPYWSTKTEAIVANAEQFLEFIRKHELWILLTLKANAEMVEKFVESYDRCPPGIELRRTRTLNLNTSGAKK